MKPFTVLSIQSHVACGHVGNRSAVFPLERLGIEVLAVNTVQYSSHAGRPGWKGLTLPPEHIREVVEALSAQGELAHCDAVLSGYMGHAGQAILDAVALVRQTNPAALYCCDPVMGDLPGGLYVAADIPDLMRTRAIPASDIVTPNLFEASCLSGITIEDPAGTAEAVRRIHQLGPRIVVLTSYSLPGMEDTGFFLSYRHPDPAGATTCSQYLLRTPRLAFPMPPKGAGDLFSALFLGQYLRRGNPGAALEMAASALYTVLEATIARGRSDLAIVAAQGGLEQPPRRFRCQEFHIPLESSAENP